MELTILMPCLNEAETIATCVKKAKGFLDRTGIAGEVLISDNGSTDGSQELARANGARVVAAPERGYGAALLNGIANAQGRFIIMGDADDSYDFSALDGIVEHLRSGAQLVMGNRFKGGIAPGAMPPLHRYLGNPVLSFIGRLFFHTPVRDFHCGLRGFSRADIQALNLQFTGMEFASEMVIKASLSGFRIDEVPVRLSPDGRSRAPHLRTWRDGWRHLRLLLLYSPRWLFLIPGIVLILFGMTGSILLAPGPLHITKGVVMDVHTLMIACFAVLIGVQLIVFAGLARQYSLQEGFLPGPKYEAFFLGLTLERILQGSLVIFLAGMAGVLHAVLDWGQSGFAPILYNDTMRILVISLTGVAVSVQLAAAGFLASVFRLRRA